MTCGIYQITVTPTGRTYVGSSSNIEQRWRDHLVAIRYGHHRYKELVGAEIAMTILRKCKETHLCFFEQIAMDETPRHLLMNKVRATDDGASGERRRRKIDPAVYEIVHVSGVTYVGSTTQIQTRLSTHRRELKSGTSFNHLLQEWWNRTTPDQWAFVFYRSSSSGNDLLAEEQALMDKVPTSLRLNRCPIAGRVKGRRHTAVTKKRLSAAKLGRKMSPKSVAINRLAQLARHKREREQGIVRTQSHEVKEKMRQRAALRTHSTETKKKIGDIVRGIKRRPETRERMRQARLAWWRKRKEEKDNDD